MRIPLLALGWALTLVASFGLGWFLASRAEPNWDAVRASEAEPWLEARTGPEGALASGSQPALGDAVRAALRQADRLDRFRELVPALGALGPENLPEVLEAYEEEEAGIGDCELRPFLYTWARFDPEGAFERVRGWGTRVRRRMGTEAVVYAWALRDPLAARRAVESIEDDPNGRKRSQRALVNGWVHSGVPGLMEYLASLPEGPNRGALTSLSLAVIRWAGGTEAMLGLVSALPDDAESGFKRTAFRKATQLIAKRNPRRAAQLVEAQPNRDWAEDGIRIVAERWVPADPSAAFDWLRAKPSGEARDRAVEAGFTRWWRTDRAAAGDWLRSATLTEFHDPALDFFTRELAAESPEEAITWVRRIADAELRMECLTTVGRRWLRADPEAARAWIAESELPEEARRALLETPPRGRRRPSRELPELQQGERRPTNIEIEGPDPADLF